MCPGAIVTALRARGHKVTASDLVDHGCQEATSGIDFLLERRAPDGVACVIMNPAVQVGRRIRRARAGARDSESHGAASSRFPGERTAPRHPRFRDSRPGLPVSKSLADDAPRRLARAEGVKRSPVRLVCMVSRPFRADRAAPHLLGAIMTATRERLPDRRLCETFAFECHDLRYVASISRYPDGSLAEIFISNAKAGSHSERLPRTPP